ncbi:hypothetical protein EG103P2_00091 [Enterococcus phage EG103P2]|nr:hypothetical protein EG103P2_00091 [Enterococcus phage EG103P2]
MNSTYVPVYTPHTTYPLAPSLGWGIGDALGWIPYNVDSMTEITPASGTTYVQSQQIPENGIQITLGFDVMGAIAREFPEFFQDCYIEADKIAKVRERTREYLFSVTANHNVEVYLESEDTQLARKSTGSQGTFTWTISSEKPLDDYTFDNGWVYLSVVVPAATSLADLNLSATVTPKFLFDPVYDTKPRTFRYNGLKQPYYLFVRDINRSVLPAVNNLLTAYDRGKRNFNYGKTYGDRVISMNCFIKANKEEDIPYLIEDLANYLDIGETTIRFADAKDRSWKVVFEGASEINQSLNVGDFTLNFRCIEVTSYGDEVTGQVTMDTDEGTFFQIFNEGTAETHPVMKITFEEDSPMVNIVGMGESENVTLGYDSSEGTGTGTNFDPMPWQFSEYYDNMNALKQMDNNTTPSFLLYQDFIRNTTLESTYGTLMLKNNKFPKVDRSKVGYKWYGGGVTRVNPKALNDFALEIAFSTQGNPQYWTDHHMYIILYDDQMIPFANVAFGYVAKQKKIRFHIATMGSSTQDEVRISPGWGGKEWYNFTGKIIIERKDNRWRLQAGQFKSKKRSPMIGSDLQYGTSMLRNVRSTGFRSLPQETWNRKFAAYGVLYANIDNRPQINRWAVHHTKCWEILQKPTNSPQITRSFKKDDELIVDFTKGQVWLNGTIAPSYVQPSTDWFSLKPGKNTLGISGVKGKVEYEYTNRYK